MTNQHNELGALAAKQLDGNEVFRCGGNALPQRVLDFWRWAYSNLAANNLRGHLAEFLVASDLHIARGVRIEWDDCDLRTQAGSNGIKIEVKSAAYLQAWRQSRPSVISFDIAPSRAYNAKINSRDSVATRNAKVYVFCLLAHKDKPTLDPTNLDQWEFYVLSTQRLTDELGKQKTLSLNRLLRLGPRKCRYGEISQAVDAVLLDDTKPAVG
ncbi:MAG: hypothetical protein IPN53_14205 [Comamonadaceae bacterium]|nr:hypothetical protein [Comamonadaceae bacterium]